MVGIVNRTSIHNGVDWIPDPPDAPLRFPQLEASSSLAPDSPLSPPPEDMDLDQPWLEDAPQSPHSPPTESQEQSQRPQSPHSPPTESQEQSQSNIPVPTTEAELWRAVKTRAIQLFKEERDNPAFKPKHSNPQHEGPLAHHKINWRIAQLAALIAICEDSSVKGFRSLTVSTDWLEDRTTFLPDLDEHIEAMLQKLAKIAAIWMQAKIDDLNDRSSAPAPSPAPATGEHVVAGPSTSDNAGSTSTKDEAKAKPKDKGKRKAEDQDRTSTDEVQEQGEEHVPKKPKGERDDKDTAAQRKVREWYGQISVPTGHGLSAGAHIWSVGARARTSLLRAALKMFYNEADVKRWMSAVLSDMNRQRNILPMEPTFHDLFDRFQAAFRPVQCYLDPKKRIYLQFDLNLEIDPQTFQRRQCRATPALPMTNYRAPIFDKKTGNKGFEELRHGQVLEIVNIDGDETKLPSFDICDLTYRLTRIIGPLKGAGLQRLMFQKRHPDVDPVPADDIKSDGNLPAFQEVMLAAALESGVITHETLPGWRAVALAQEVEEGARVNEEGLAVVRLAEMLKVQGPDQEEDQGESSREPTESKFSSLSFSGLMISGRKDRKEQQKKQPGDDDTTSPSKENRPTTTTAHKNEKSFKLRFQSKAKTVGRLFSIGKTQKTGKRPSMTEGFWVPPGAGSLLMEGQGEAAAEEE
ncbi:hypothetical protein CONLIGDRAFT_686814 [Coniochaeta ligniaria NRRL 30616]|uniref:HNH nuclease domain-containing protein n=1 Tax=Coniochaeta ligniaria NRRL 30616 TaxID=1408157 RepID=A0A1J7J0H3_9PEZI|nr:hypothetical protein CONLIGDRAFT_686814 [Coniochaeta ligniaria NRRL 30616]